MLRAAQRGGGKKRKKWPEVFSASNEQWLTGAIAFGNGGVPPLIVSGWVSSPSSWCWSCGQDALGGSHKLGAPPLRLGLAEGSTVMLMIPSGPLAEDICVPCYGGTHQRLPAGWL